jgi:hypothetical protein
MAALLRVLVILLGCIWLVRHPGVQIEHFFWLIALGMVVQALASGTAIKLGAWTRGL